MRKIHLHGHLAKFGKVHVMDVRTAGEAVRALGSQIPGFLARLGEGSYSVVYGKKRFEGMSLGEDDITTLMLGNSDLHIMPNVVGSKRGGLLKVLLGAVLVGTALFGGLAAGGLMTAIGGMGGVTWGNVAMIGAAMMMSGVSQLLAPTEDKKDKDDSSFTTSGPGNTYEQGGAIPLVYGEVITGGIMISAGVDIEKLK